MTTLFRAVPITNAEQAEKLPKGTVALESGAQGQTTGASIRVRGGWFITGEDTADGTPHLYKHSDMVGDQALVPVEAEEEWAETNPFGGVDPVFTEQQAREQSAHNGNRPSRRLVTPWEEV